MNSHQILAVLRGEYANAEVTCASRVEAAIKKQQWQSRMRVIKHRNPPADEQQAARYAKVVVYVDPHDPRRVICDASGFDGKRNRHYAQVERLKVGESCILAVEHYVQERSIHQRLSAIARAAYRDLGVRPAFNCAPTDRPGHWRITRLKDGANPRFDPLTYSGPTLKAIEANLE